MVGHGCVGIAPRTTGIGDLGECWVAVAPLRVHLQIAAILVGSRSCEVRVAKDPHHFSAAEKMASQRSTTVDLVARTARVNGLLDGGRHAAVEHLVNHSG